MVFDITVPSIDRTHWRNQIDAGGQLLLNQRSGDSYRFVLIRRHHEHQPYVRRACHTLNLAAKACHSKRSGRYRMRPDDIDRQGQHLGYEGGD